MLPVFVNIEASATLGQRRPIFLATQAEGSLTSHKLLPSRRAAAGVLLKAQAGDAFG
jgi:hypothetical protein